MGTRNLSMAKVDGKLKIAQYGQWDGYPDGAGVDILNFIKNVDMNSFKEKVRQCEWVDDNFIDEVCKSIGINGWMSLDESRKFKELYPEFHRDTGCEIFYLVNGSQNGLRLSNSSEFGNDGLFCEWAYLIDLDKESLTVYANGVSEESKVEEFSFELLREISKLDFVNILNKIVEEKNS